MTNRDKADIALIIENKFNSLMKPYIEQIRTNTQTLEGTKEHPETGLVQKMNSFETKFFTLSAIGSGFSVLVGWFSRSIFGIK
jgi:hypothetical protein